MITAKIANLYKKINGKIRFHASEPYKFGSSKIGLFSIFFITIAIFISYSPFLYYTFGVHNDFEIWSWSDKSCCFSWPESGMLVKIGRFIQAILQTLYLSLFTDLHSFTYGRIFAMLLMSAGAILLMYFGKKNGMGKTSSIAFGITVFLLPSAILSLSWPTNFIPGIFNVVFALAIAAIFPTWKSVYNGVLKSRILLLISFILLIASLFIYSPTSGFFLIPIMIGLLYNINKKFDVRLQAVFTTLFFFFACLIYFILHRVIYLNIMNIKQAGASLYRFDLTSNIFINLWKFFSEISPPMLNLWNAAPTFGIVVLYFSFFFIPIYFYLFKRKTVPGNNYLIPPALIDVVLFTILFFAAISSGLLAIGRPPQYYRVWYAGAAIPVLLLFKSLDFYPWNKFKNIIIYILIVIASLLSFDTSYFVANTLAKQFEYSTEQIPSQYSHERDQYIVVEYRPKSMFLGVPRWGEFSFLYTLSPGHVGYILKKYLNTEYQPHTETIVVDQKENEILLEPEFITDEVSWIVKPKRSDPEFKNINALFDSHEEFFYEVSGTTKTKINFEIIDETQIGCYKFYAGSLESAERMPRSWILYASDNLVDWHRIDSQSNQTKWLEGENRSYYTKNSGKFKYFRLDVEASNNSEFVRIPELRLFSNKKACQFSNNVPIYFQDTGLIKSPKTIKNVTISLGGIISESGLSDPSFRLIKAFDNITYTFWEASAFLPINLNIQFLNRKIIKCYSFMSGNDLAGTRMPRHWEFYGSNDFKKWDLLDERKNETDWIDNSRRVYNTVITNPYVYYRIKFLAINGGGILRIYEIDLSLDEDCQITIP